VVTPRQLSFDAGRWTSCHGVSSGTAPAPQEVVIRNTTRRPMWFLAKVVTPAARSWLSVRPFAHSVAPGATRTLTASVEPEQLHAGTYSATIVVYSLTHPYPNPHRAAIDHETLSVTLTVSPAPPRPCVSPSSLDFGTLKPHARSGAKALFVGNAGDGALDWSAAASASDGTVELARDGHVLRVSIVAGRENGRQEGEVVITAPGAPPSTVKLSWKVAGKGNAHGHDDECRGDHDGDRDHDDDDRRRHRRGDR
jgi:hypothetical protein